MILTDNETKIDLLNNEAIAATIIGLLRERPDRPVTTRAHGDGGPRVQTLVVFYRTKAITATLLSGGRGGTHWL